MQIHRNGGAKPENLTRDRTKRGVSGIDGLTLTDFGKGMIFREIPNKIESEWTNPLYRCWGLLDNQAALLPAIEASSNATVTALVAGDDE